MKFKSIFKTLSLILATTCSLSTMAVIASAESYSEILSSEENVDDISFVGDFEMISDPPLESIGEDTGCSHSVLCTFDNINMTVNDVYENMDISDLLEDISYYSDNHSAVVLKDGEEIYDGLLEEGMLIQVYHDEELYGEYTVGAVAHLPNTVLANYSNIVKPLDALNLSTDLTCQFGCENNNQLCSWCSANAPYFVGRIHNGQDIRGESVNGETIRAMKEGVISDLNNTSASTGYGSYVKIKHDDGTFTLYAHMQYNSVSVYKDQRVAKGTVLGKVGNTGLSTAPHLHLSVFVGNTATDPMPYLTAATTYNAPSNNYKVITSSITVRSNPSVSASSHGTVSNGTTLSISKMLIDKNTTNIFGMISSGTYQGKWIALGTTLGDTYAINMSDIWYVFDGPINIRATSSTSSQSYGYATTGSSFYLNDVIVSGDYIMGKIASSPSPAMESGSTCSVANAKNHWIALNYCAPYIS